MTEEEWRPVVGLENRYEVSSLGRVRSLGKNRIMRPRGGNYKHLSLYTGNTDLPLSKRYITRSVHQIVAEAFIGPKPPFTEVLHIDGNRYNNAAQNLRYGTHEENVEDAVQHGVYKGSRNGRSKLDEKDVSAIRQLLSEGVSQSTIARAFNVTPAAIRFLKIGEHWSHVDD